MIRSMRKTNLSLFFIIPLILNGCLKREVISCNCKEIVTFSDQKILFENINKLFNMSDKYYNLTQEETYKINITFSDGGLYSFDPRNIDLNNIMIVRDSGNKDVLLELRTIDHQKEISVVLGDVIIKQAYFSLYIKSPDDALKVGQYLCYYLCRINNE